MYSRLISHLEVSCHRRNNGGPPRHSYRGVHIDGGAKVHLGDSYHFGKHTANHLPKVGALTAYLGLESPLNRLPYAEDAPFNSLVKQHEPSCLENTHVDLLQDIFD